MVKKHQMNVKDLFHSAMDREEFLTITSGVSMTDNSPSSFK